MAQTSLSRPPVVETLDADLISSGSPLSNGASSNSPDPQRSPIRAAITLVAARAILMAFSVVTNLFAARMLAPSGRGELAAGLQVGYLLAFVVVFGLDKSLAVVAPGADAGRSFFTGRSLMRWRAAAAVAIGVVATIASTGLNDRGILGFGLFVAIVAVFNGQFRLIESAVVNNDRAEWMAGLQALAGASTLGIVVLLSAAGVRSPVWWLGGYALAALIVAEAFAAFVRRSRRRELENADDGATSASEPHREMESEFATTWSLRGRRLLPASLASFATLRSDRLLLPVLADPEQLGFYVVVATFVDLASLPFESFANALVPRWRRRALDGALRAGPTLALAGGCAVIAAIGAWFFGSLLVEPLFGEAYLPARDLLPALSVAALMLAWSRLAQARALALGLDAVVSTAESVGLGGAMICYIGLIPLLGAEGAAIGSAIGYGASLLVLVIGQWRSPAVDLDVADEASDRSMNGVGA